jgi:hypothetical protein
MFDVSIVPDALAALKQKYGAAVTIRTTPRHGCCGGKVLLPVVEPGKPEQSDIWQKIEVDGVEIYYEPGIDIPLGASLKIGMEKLFVWQKFWIEGLDTQLK